MAKKKKAPDYSRRPKETRLPRPLGPTRVEVEYPAEEAAADAAFLRGRRSKILQQMRDEAADTGLDKQLDVTFEQVRIVELESENKELLAILTRLFEHRSPSDRHQQRHDPDPQCPVCGGVEAYLEGRPLTEDQRREFDQP